MITKTNERKQFTGTLTDGEYTVSATVITTSDDQLVTINSGYIRNSDNGIIGSFSKSENGGINLNAHQDDYLYAVTTSTTQFINELIETEE